MASTTPDIDRIKELRALLTEANEAYYVRDEQTMSDGEFDRLLTELADLEHAHPELVDPDSPTRIVGGGGSSRDSGRFPTPGPCSPLTTPTRWMTSGPGTNGSSRALMDSSHN